MSNAEIFPPSLKSSKVINNGGLVSPVSLVFQSKQENENHELCVDFEEFSDNFKSKCNDPFDSTEIEYEFMNENNHHNNNNQLIISGQIKNDLRNENFITENKISLSNNKTTIPNSLEQEQQDYHDAMIVKEQIDFDERAFRDHLIKKQTDLNSRIKSINIQIKIFIRNLI
jgi:hypothetical protein